MLRDTLCIVHVLAVFDDALACSYHLMLHTSCSSAMTLCTVTQRLSAQQPSVRWQA